MLNYLKSAHSIFISSVFSKSRTAKAGSINSEQITQTRFEDVPFFMKLALVDKFTKTKRNPDDYVVIKVDGDSQSPNGLRNGSTCLVDKTVEKTLLTHGDVILLKLEKTEKEAYKLRMFLGYKNDGANINSLKFNKFGVPAEKASLHPANLYVGRVSNIIKH